MSIANIIKAMPKAEINISLEGALLRSTLVMIAEANEIHLTLKHYQQWLGLVDKPDYRRLPDIIKMINSWLRYPEELVRVAYDVGVTLAKQNVRYAEVSVNPTLYEAIAISLDDLLEALNDGRSRAERGWGIRMNWIITIPREEPRRADDLARWASGLTARRAGVVGMVLSGKEEAQPIGQFERAFKNAEKKDLARAVRAGASSGAEGVIEAVRGLSPNRIIDAWGLADSEEALNLVRDQQIGVVVALTRALRHGWVSKLEDYPLKRLYDADVRLVLSSDLPSLYRTNLTDEYLAAVEQCGLDLDELEQVALNAVRASFLDEPARQELEQSFREEYARLREQEGV
ncbi:MAG: adenosine deaminase family protein [Candidatus Flexifilum sp.]|jgi:adenosine deaminase